MLFNPFSEAMNGNSAPRSNMQPPPHTPSTPVRGAVGPHRTHAQSQTSTNQAQLPGNGLPPMGNFSATDNSFGDHSQSQQHRAVPPQTPPQNRPLTYRGFSAPQSEPSVRPGRQFTYANPLPDAPEPDFQRGGKRVKITHGYNFDHLANQSINQARLSLGVPSQLQHRTVQGQPHPVHCVFDDVASVGTSAAPSPTAVQPQPTPIPAPVATPPTTPPAADDDKSSNGKAVCTQADFKLAPPKDFFAVDNNKHKFATTCECKYKTSDADWPTAKEVLQFATSNIIKPKKSSSDEEEKYNPETIKRIEQHTPEAKKIYDAMIDTSYFFRGIKAPMDKFLLGNMSRDRLIMRAYDVVKELHDYHDGRLQAFYFDEDKVGRQKGKDDSIEVRLENMLLALRYHKLIVIDVIMATTVLLYSLILSPKQTFADKMGYKKSNVHRADQYKTTKNQAKRYNDLQEEKQAE